MPVTSPLRATVCPPPAPSLNTTPGSEGSGGSSERSTGVSMMLSGDQASGGSAASFMSASLVAVTPLVSNLGSSPGAHGSIAPSRCPMGAAPK